MSRSTRLLASGLATAAWPAMRAASLMALCAGTASNAQAASGSGTESGFDSLPPKAAAASTGPTKGDLIHWPGLQLLDGQRWEPAHWVDRAAVVVFFSPDCAFCRRHNTRLEALHRQVQKEGLALDVLGVSIDGTAASVQRHQQAMGWTFPVTLDASALQGRLRGRRMVPFTSVVDRAHVLRELIPGEMSEADVMEMARWARRAA